MTFCLQGCVKDIGTETPEVIWQIKVEMNVKFGLFEKGTKFEKNLPPYI